MGRHSDPDEVDDEPVPGGPIAPITPTAPKPIKPTSAVADLQLVLHNPRLLAGCVVAALLPFGFYFIVMITTHRMYDWALFLGAPLVLAGILVGSVLDRAYSRLGRREPALTAPASAVPAGLGSRSAEGARP